VAALALKKEKGGDEELIVDVKVQNWLLGTFGDLQRFELILAHFG
jgi:hypothetical protein